MKSRADVFANALNTPTPIDMVLVPVQTYRAVDRWLNARAAVTEKVVLAVFLLLLA
jgi:hypothetical protein